MKSSTLFSAGVLTLFCGFGFAQQANVEIQLRTLADQPLPVVITGGTIHPFGDTSELVATTSSLKNAEIKSAEFYLVVFHGDRIIGGEGWTETDPSSITRQTRLALHEGDQALLVVDSVTTSTRTFTLAKSDVTESVLKVIHGDATIAPPVQISMLALSGHLLRVQSGGTFCGDALAAAKSGCGSAGIASFSCNQTQQSFSFTCNGNKVSQPPPGNN